MLLVKKDTDPSLSAWLYVVFRSENLSLIYFEVNLLVYYIFNITSSLFPCCTKQDLT